MKNTESSFPVVINCIFSKNSAQYGGGMYNYTHIPFTGTIILTSPIIINTIFSNNSAQYGGGLYSSSSAPTVINSIFWKNIVEVYGGGMEINNNRYSLYPTITNSIFWGNIGWANGYNWGNTPNQINGSAIVTYSDIQNGYNGTGNIDSDPLFVDAENGDFRLQANSLAIDAGKNSALPKDTTDCNGDRNTTEILSCDLDGYSRIVDETVDMGAYEYGSIKD